VRPHGEVKCDDCAVIDGSGKTLMPGLIDAHVHLTGSPAPPWHVTRPDEDHNGAALLYAGVTTAMDVGGERSALSSLSARSKAGTWLRPDFTHAGMLITRPAVVRLVEAATRQHDCRPRHASFCATKAMATNPR
jgi:imidazolonepropionase-like amidohydrolase